MRMPLFQLDMNELTPSAAAMIAAWTVGGYVLGSQSRVGGPLGMLLGFGGTAFISLVRIRGL